MGTSVAARAAAISALTALIMSGLAMPALAAGGSLDTSFGYAGKVTTNFSSSARDVVRSIAIQADGKIVAGGNSTVVALGGDSSFALARYNADGSLDSSFDGDGKVTTTFGYSAAESIAIQADGKIVAGGWAIQGTTYDFALARYNADASLDTSFDTDGKVTTGLGSGDDVIRSIAIQADGKIVAGGYSSNGSNWDFALARYNADGSLDTSFDTDGKLTTAFGSAADVVTSVAIHPGNGKIVAGGYSSNGSNDDFALARYNVDGSLDTGWGPAGFGTDGKTTTPIGSGDDVARSIAIQADGKIVAGGYTEAGPNYSDFALVRYTANGRLDTSFDSDGKVTTTFGASYDLVYSIALQADGKIIAGGETFYTYGDFALARYNSDGSLDVSFGSDGRVRTAFVSHDDAASSIALQADGKIIAGGYARFGSEDYVFALARYDSGIPHALTVTKSGSGSGTIASDPPGIDCGTDCAENFAENTSVTLSATPSGGSTFTGWSGGGCSGTGTCTLTMDAARTIDAAFATGPDSTTCPGFESDPRNQIVGTPASETLTGTTGPDIICGLGGNDRLEGGAGDDVLLGGIGIDALSGSAGTDRLDGAAGRDSLSGGAGADTLIGGTSGDTATYGGSPTGVTVDLSVTPGTGSGGDAQGDSLSGIENLWGTGHIDSLTGSTAANTIRGFGSGDTLKGLGGTDTLDYTSSIAGVTVDLRSSPVTVSGGHAQGDVATLFERVVGSGFADVLHGNNLANWLTGAAGNDSLFGYGGNDRLLGGTGTDTFDGGDGLDFCDDRTGESDVNCE